jgi:D-inositol-3-phosphate glycosyltransferase
MKKLRVAIEDLGLDVCHSVGTSHTDGRGVASLSIAETLQDRGHIVELLMRPFRKLPAKWANKITCRQVEADYLQRCASDGHAYDLVLVNHFSLANSVSGLPVIYQPHEIEALRAERTCQGTTNARESQQTLFDNSLAVLVPSLAIYQYLLDHKLVTSERLFLTPHGVDPKRFYPVDKKLARTLLKITDSPMILYVGPLEKRKGLGILMDAFEMLPQTYHLWIVGEPVPHGDAEDAKLCKQLNKWSSQPRFENRIHMVDGQPWSKLILYYSAADVAAYGSLMEPWGMPTIEALACGLPVVGSNLDGFKELIRPGKDGLLFEAGNATAFSEALVHIVSESSWRSHHAIRNRVDRARTFTWDRTAITIETITNSVITKRALTVKV